MMHRMAKGSFTVEASLVLPIFLFMMITACGIGFDLYREMRDGNEQQQIEEMWLVDDFYRIECVGETAKEVSGK